MNDTATASTPPRSSPRSTRSRPTPAAAQFQFRARNEWLSGTHNRSDHRRLLRRRRGATHEHEFTFDADHPAVLVGRDNGPTPVEYVLHALAACLTAGLANIAAARGVPLTEVRSTVSGDIDLNGILGLNPVRNGYQNINVRFTVKGDAPAEDAARASSSSPGPLGRLRHHHQRRAGHHRGRGGLTRAPRRFDAGYRAGSAAITASPAR